MDDTTGVKRDILDFLRDNHLDVGGPLHEGPFYVQKMVHYNANQKAALRRRLRNSSPRVCSNNATAPWS